MAQPHLPQGGVMPQTNRARQQQPEQEEPTPPCPHGQDAGEVARRDAQVEAMAVKPWPSTVCICCKGPALAPENTDELWSGVRCSRCPA